MQLSCSLHYAKISCSFASIYCEILLILHPSKTLQVVCRFTQRSSRFHGNLLLSCNFLLKIGVGVEGDSGRDGSQCLDDQKQSWGSMPLLHSRLIIFSVPSCSLGSFSLPHLLLLFSGPGSSVGIATDYGMDGPGIEPRWKRDFSHNSRPAHPASCTMGTGSFQGVKRPGRGADHPPPSSAEVENE
jgi:hypothetical protein